MKILNALLLILKNFKFVFRQFYWEWFACFDKKSYGHFGKNIELIPPIYWGGGVKRTYLSDNVTIKGHLRLIVAGEEGKFVMKKHSGAARGLTVVINAHPTYPQIGQWNRYSHKYDQNKDVVVEEDVWIAANVTLLAGVTVGRGSIVGAGSVCRKSVPPYAIVMGNPAKIVGFKYTPEEVIEHEKALYPEEERLPFEKLQRNYEKYYLKRITEIAKYVKQ